MRTASSIIGFPEPGEWWKARNFKFIRGPLQSLPENADIIATCILHNYLKQQVVRLSDMGSSASVRRNLTKLPNQGGSAHHSAFEVRDKFKQFFNSQFGSVPWENERVKC
jgi:hypothetical protein